MSSTVSTDYVKPLAAAASSFAMDKFILQNSNTMSSAYFAGAVGLSLFGVGMVEVNVPRFLPDIVSIGASGQTLSNRVAEIAGGVGATYVVSKFLVKDNSSSQMLMKRMAVVVAADFVGEYVSDYVSNKPLSYLA